MTIEQLAEGNKICEKIRRLKDFMVALNDVKRSNTLIANYHKYYLGEPQDDKQVLCLDDYPELTVMIGDYISEQIRNLEKQLEEL